MRRKSHAWCGSGVVVAAAFALLTWAADASGQTRNGFWFGAGGGYGAAQTCFQGGCGERKGSGVGYLQAGYTLNEQLLLGGELGFWSKRYPYQRVEDYARVSMYHLTGTAMYYPQRTRGLFVKGGAGMALIDSFVTTSGFAVDADLGKGLGLIIGAGYDIPVGPVAVTPAFNYWYGKIGDLKTGCETFAANHKQNVMALTVGVTIP